MHTVRALACYLISEQPIAFAEKLALVQPLADGHHSYVREWAWRDLREDCTVALERSVALLPPWTADPITSDALPWSSPGLAEFGANILVHYASNHS